MQDDQTRSVAGQPPAQQWQAQRRQRDFQAGNVPATLYDIDLRSIRLVVNMPALSDNAQDWLARCSMANVLRQPGGCTIEALVVNPVVCCKSDDDVQAVQRLPWWWCAVQMRSLVDEGTLTLGHWNDLDFLGRERYVQIKSVLNYHLQAAECHGIVTTELTPLKQLYAENRDFNVRENLASYFRDLANQRLTEERERARLAEERAAEERARSLALAADLAALHFSLAQHVLPPAVPAVTTQTRQLLPLDRYGQKEEQLLSAAVGQALYDSVYNATWGALQYSTYEKTNGCITYAERETALPVTLDDQGIEVAENHSMHAAQHTDGIAMLTLYSQHGWPTSWAFDLTYAENSPVNVPVPQQTQQSRNPAVIDDAERHKLLYVRYEVQRAWRHAARLYNKHNRNARLSTLPLGDVPPATTPTQRVDRVRVGLFVLGTPGIGKTMSGNYMVYRLLHDVNAPPYIAFAVGDYVFVFDKRHRVVSCYERDDFRRNAFSLWCGTQCVYIHDCAAGEYQLREKDGPKEALMLALSSPNKANYVQALDKFREKAKACTIVVNSWSYRELCCVAPLVGVRLDTLRERVVHVGPLPRHVYDTTKIQNRMLLVKQAVDVRANDLHNLAGITAVDNTTRGEDDRNPTNVLYDMYRVQSDENQQDDNVPMRSDEWKFRLFAERIPSMLLSKLMCYYISNMYKILDTSVYLSTDTASYEMCVKVAITLRLFWRGVHTARDAGDNVRFHRCLRPDTTPLLEPALVPLTAADIQHWTQGAPDMLNVCAVGKNETTIAFGASDTAVVYIPESAAFALIDAFLLVRESAANVHFIGVQATTAADHPVTHSRLEHFVKNMPEMRIAVAAPQPQANEQQPQQVTTAQPAARGTTSAQATVAAGKEDAAAARVAKLGRLQASIASWSVVYVGEKLRDSNMFEVQRQGTQQRTGTLRATGAQQRTRTEALTATGAQQRTKTHSDASQPRARRAASSTPAAHVGGTAQRRTDPGNAAETAQQAQVHANDTADPYIAFWNKVTRYIYKASHQHLKNVRDTSLADFNDRQKLEEEEKAKRAEQKQQEQQAENENEEENIKQVQPIVTQPQTKHLLLLDDEDEEQQERTTAQQ